MRVVKYGVSFAFCSDDGNIVGALPEKKMTFVDLEHTLRILSPMASVDWSNTIKSLPRNSFTILEVHERLSSGQTIIKKLKVTR